jgi:glutamate decarboxylase
VFKVDYLGGEMPTFALNFSRPGAQIIAQYYVFLRLGSDGFTRVQQAARDVATGLSGSIAEIGPFELLSRGAELPVFAFRLRDNVTGYSVYDVSEHLRTRGWIVPAYRMPEAITDMAVLRVCVRNGFGRDLADHLVTDLRDAVEALDKRGGGAPADDSFHH